MSESSEAAHLRALAFKRRCKAARERRHLPTLPGLLMGMPFFGDALDEDLIEFSERLLVKLAPDPPDPELHEALKFLQSLPGPEELRMIADALRNAKLPGRLKGSVCALRCYYYAACLGDVLAAMEVAKAAVELAHWRGRNEEEIFRFCREALGWLFVIAHTPKASESRSSSWSGFSDARNTVHMNGGNLLSAAVQGYADAQEHRRTRERNWRSRRSDSPPPRASGSDRETKEVVIDPPGSAVVVVPSIGNTYTAEGSRIGAILEKAAGVAFKLVPTPDMRTARASLLEEFPQAERVVEVLLGELADRRYVRLRPTILQGAPGAGKSKFATSFLKALGVPSVVYPCGGVSDGTIAGSARHWATSEPSLALNLIIGSKCASPGVILDEIEKVALGRHNGNALDALLAFLERETAEKWFDPYVEAPIDVSHVIWLATSNDTSGLPDPLRDRFRIVAFPEPGPEHLPQLAPRLLRQAVIERGLDERWATPLTGEELAALAEAWPGGSVRKLQRFVEVVLAARDRCADVQ